MPSDGLHPSPEEVWLPEVHFGVSGLQLERAFPLNGNVNGGRSIDGVVGAASLDLKRIAFDFKHRSSIWKFGRDRRILSSQLSRKSCLSAQQRFSWVSST